MYVKIESVSLKFIRYNQTKLRSEEFIHIRDGIVGNIDENLSPNDIDSAFILPSSNIGSPRNMQEYIQNLMTYARNYGRPDLFITFTYNPNFELNGRLVPFGKHYGCYSQWLQYLYIQNIHRLPKTIFGQFASLQLVKTLS
ncbi:helitron_like_N domain-containing protein [Nephila pilipes]|uniref:Helitron_like_N domain-containing protein n=1 Tax=Nephila pilipes TaxID=299642 RepID=A0A8X6T972_NEPPI|nr:helitron_like_N domain-containing protein [Nephila pilipes]